jgi:hypothetical protein
MPLIDVPIGPAKVEYGATTPTVFDKTKGGVQFQANTSKQDVTIDQFGDTPVKSILKGRTCQAVVPFALHDLDKFAKVTPDSKLTTHATDPLKKRLDVYANAGYNLLDDADKLVIIPLDPSATANDWITIHQAVPIGDPQFTYNSDNERIFTITFVGYPDDKGLLYTLGDTSVVVPA